MYIDANNLYGYAMIKKLQINSFKWIDDLKRFTSEFIKNQDIDSDTGYLLEVDIKKKKKKESYVVHIQALKQALLHGLELKKVYRVISFRQKAQLKAYIEINTKLKNDAKNEFEKDFF